MWFSYFLTASLTIVILKNLQLMVTLNLPYLEVLKDHRSLENLKGLVGQMDLREFPYFIDQLLAQIAQHRTLGKVA